MTTAQEFSFNSRVDLERQIDAFPEGTFDQTQMGIAVTRAYGLDNSLQPERVTLKIACAER